MDQAQEYKCPHCGHVGEPNLSGVALLCDNCAMLVDFVDPRTWHPSSQRVERDRLRRLAYEQLQHRLTDERIKEQMSTSEEKPAEQPTEEEEEFWSTLEQEEWDEGPTQSELLGNTSGNVWVIALLLVAVVASGVLLFVLI